MKSMTMEELAAEANKLLATSVATDKRQSSLVSARRIRDYISKGLLDKPLKNGKYNYFNETHLEKLISIRELQNDGLSDNSIKKLSNTTNLNVGSSVIVSGAMASSASALNAIEEIKKNIASNINEPSKNLINSFYANTNQSSKIAPLNNTVIRSKNWKEYPLDLEGKFFLKVEEGSIPTNTNEILENIKSILNIKGDKND